MQIHKVPASHGARWFVQAVNVGARNPRAVFGAALLFVATLYLLMLGTAVVAAMFLGAGAGGEPDKQQLLIAAVPVLAILLLAFPVLLGGLMHVIAEAEAGRPVRPLDLYAPFRLRKAGALAGLGGVQLVLTVLGGLVLVALAGSDFYVEAMRAALEGRVVVGGEPDHPGLMLLFQVLFNYFGTALMLLCVPLLLFGDGRLGAALRAALRAALVNAPAYLLLGLLFMAALFVSALLVTAVNALLLAVGGQVLGTLLSGAVSFFYGAVVLMVLVGATLMAWRGTFQGNGAAPTAGNTLHVEA